MAPSSTAPYNPAAYVAPESLLPAEAFGYVDLETLTDIHRCLCDSESREDIELATWVRDNYLDGLVDISRPVEICTAQAFGKLDRAYRRVRSLTNKAQEKWPFLDRYFKTMSSAMVRSNARGEVAPGIMFPIDRLQSKSCLAGQPLHGSLTHNASAGPGLQVPFGTDKPSRYQPYVQSYPRPTRQTPVPLPCNPFTTSSEQPSSENQSVPEPRLSLAPSQDTSKYTDLFSESDGWAMSQSEPPQSKMPKTEGVIGQNLSQDEIDAPLSKPVGGNPSRRSSSDPSGILDVESTVRDAVAGKVRGTNGRYLPKEDVEPEPKKPTNGVKTRTSMRNAKKRESLAPNLVAGESETAPTKDENMIASVHSPSPSLLIQETEEKNRMENKVPDDPATDVVTPPGPTVVSEQEVEMEEDIVSGSGSTPAYLLAAEADAVPSNLDKLPPESRKSTKRKSEPAAQSGDRKRGKHGGIVGRSRNSEQQGDLAPPQEPVRQQGETVVEPEEPPQMVTRRTTRRSAAADLNTSVSSKPAVNSTAKSFIKAPVKKPRRTQVHASRSSTAHEDEVMSGVEEHATAAHRETIKTTPDFSEARPTPLHTLENIPHPQLSDNHLLSIGLDRTSSPALDAQPAARQQPHQSHEQTPSSPPPPTFVPKRTTNGTGSAYPPGHVEYFARISTGNGNTIDLPIEEDQIETDEVSMVKKYAKYNAAPDVAPVSYTQFRDIFAFAKQG